MVCEVIATASFGAGTVCASFGARRSGGRAPHRQVKRRDRSDGQTESYQRVPDRAFACFGHDVPLPLKNLMKTDLDGVAAGPLRAELRGH